MLDHDEMTNFVTIPTPTREKKKINLYKLIVARSDITAALTACRLFLEKVDRLGHELWKKGKKGTVLFY